MTITTYTDREIALQKRVAELEKENLRLCGEVSNRNKRALEGDKAQAAFDQLYAEHEALLTQVETSRKQTVEEPFRWYDPAERELFADLMLESREVQKRVIPLYAAPVVAPDVLRDAERYRWLREQVYVDKESRLRIARTYLLSEPGTTLQQRLDAAIDAAMGGAND